MAKRKKKESRALLVYLDEKEKMVENRHLNDLLSKISNLSIVTSGFDLKGLKRGVESKRSKLCMVVVYCCGIPVDIEMAREISSICENKVVKNNVFLHSLGTLQGEKIFHNQLFIRSISEYFAPEEIEEEVIRETALEFYCE